MKAFSDSDWAGAKDERRSIAGYCVYLNGCLISWKSRGQKLVTLSSTEAEYVAVSEACTDIKFIKMIMEFLELEVERPIKFIVIMLEPSLWGTMQNRVREQNISM